VWALIEGTECIRNSIVATEEGFTGLRSDKSVRSRSGCGDGVCLAGLGSIASSGRQLNQWTFVHTVLKYFRLMMCL